MQRAFNPRQGQGSEKGFFSNDGGKSKECRVENRLKEATQVMAPYDPILSGDAQQSVDLG